MSVLDLAVCMSVLYFCCLYVCPVLLLSVCLSLYCVCISVLYFASVYVFAVSLCGVLTTILSPGKCAVSHLLSLSDNVLTLLPFIEPRQQRDHDTKLTKSSVSSRYAAVLLLTLLKSEYSGTPPPDVRAPLYKGHFAES